MRSGAGDGACGLSLQAELMPPAFFLGTRARLQRPARAFRSTGATTTRESSSIPPSRRGRTFECKTEARAHCLGWHVGCRPEGARILRSPASDQKVPSGGQSFEGPLKCLHLRTSGYFPKEASEPASSRVRLNTIRSPTGTPFRGSNQIALVACPTCPTCRVLSHPD